MKTTESTQKLTEGTRVRFSAKRNAPPGEQSALGTVLRYGADLSGPGVWVRWDATPVLPELTQCVDEQDLVEVSP